MNKRNTRFTVPSHWVMAAQGRALSKMIVQQKEVKMSN